jgi:hypothetical protein
MLTWRKFETHCTACHLTFAVEPVDPTVPQRVTCPHCGTVATVSPLPREEMTHA